MPAVLAAATSAELPGIRLPQVLFGKSEEKDKIIDGPTNSD
jgi:hypothetical protein